MDGHSKREVLKIFNMNEKNDVIARFLFLNRPPILENCLQNGHLIYHVTYQHNVYTLNC